MNKKLSLKDIQTAVKVFADANFDKKTMMPLMNLLLQQEPYIQTRFWKLSHAAYLAKVDATRSFKTNSFYPELEFATKKATAK